MKFLKKRWPDLLLAFLFIVVGFVLHHEYWPGIYHHYHFRADIAKRDIRDRLVDSENVFWCRNRCGDLSPENTRKFNLYLDSVKMFQYSPEYLHWIDSMHLWADVKCDCAAMAEKPMDADTPVSIRIDTTPYAMPAGHPPHKKDDSTYWQSDTTIKAIIGDSRVAIHRYVGTLGDQTTEQIKKRWARDVVGLQFTRYDAPRPPKPSRQHYIVGYTATNPRNGALHAGNIEIVARHFPSCDELIEEIEKRDTLIMCQIVSISKATPKEIKLFYAKAPKPAEKKPANDY